MDFSIVGCRQFLILMKCTFPTMEANLTKCKCCNSDNSSSISPQGFTTFSSEIDLVGVHVDRSKIFASKILGDELAQAVAMKKWIKKMEKCLEGISHSHTVSLFGITSIRTFIRGNSVNIAWSDVKKGLRSFPQPLISSFHKALVCTLSKHN